MKKRFIKKAATIFWAGNKDPDCRCFDRRMTRSTHKIYAYKLYEKFISEANKKDWEAFYYYQERVCFHLKKEDAKKAAHNSMKDYVRLPRKSLVFKHIPTKRQRKLLKYRNYKK